MPSRGASSNLWLSQGDNKACVFPLKSKKVEILLLKHYPLCLWFPPGPPQVRMDVWAEGRAENVHHVVSHGEKKRLSLARNVPVRLNL